MKKTDTKLTADPCARWLCIDSVHAAQAQRACLSQAAPLWTEGKREEREWQTPFHWPYAVLNPVSKVTY